MADEIPSPPPAARMLVQGEQGLLIELGDRIDEATNARVLALARAVSRELAGQVGEVVPSYRSLLVTFDPLQVSRLELQARLAVLVAQTAGDCTDPEASRCLLLPVCYGGELGPDLGFVAQHCGLSESQVVEIHTGTPYRVYMLGFTPGFPYLGGLARRIAAPRLPQPRTRIAAGSVGIAGEQTGVYPVDSPGGWRLIGRTPVRLFNPDSEQPFLLAAGDFLRFVAVDRREFQAVARRVEAGQYRPEITPLLRGALR